MPSKKLIFAFLVLSIFTVTHTSLLVGVLKIFGLDVLLPCKLIIDIILFGVKAMIPLLVMVETAVDGGKTMLQTSTISASMLLQKSYNELMTVIPEILEQSTDDECFRNMTIKYQDIIQYHLNGSNYVANYLEAIEEFREGLIEARETGLAYFDRFNSCNNCECVSTLIEAASEWTLKLGPILVKNWIIEMLNVVDTASDIAKTDLIYFVTNMSMGFHDMIFDYQRCISTRL